MSEAGATIAAVVGHAVQRGSRTVEPSAEAEQAWVARLLDGASPLRGSGSGEGGRRELLLPGSSECTPGYYNNEGQPASAAQRSSVLGFPGGPLAFRSEEHTSELQSLMRISYAVFCLTKKKNQTDYHPYSPAL